MVRSLRNALAFVVGVLIFLFFTIVLSVALRSTAAHAEPAGVVQITDSPGGVIGSFIDRYTRIRVAGERVVISGYCNSSCTLITGIVPADRVCVRPGATFGFHSASDPNTGRYAADGTKLMWSFYPQNVRSRLIKQGWAGDRAHPDLINIKGTAIYRLCKES